MPTRPLKRGLVFISPLMIMIPSLLARENHMGDLTKNDLLEKLKKLIQTDRDLNFLLSLDEKDMTTLLIALRERIERMK
jgi:hypothetical protein